jgi:hypothetical protein
MKLLTTIAAVLISISAFSQEKLIYHGDGIITQGLDTVSLGEFKGMCDSKSVKFKYFNRTTKYLAAGSSQEKTKELNSLPKALSIAAIAAGTASLAVWFSDWDFWGGSSYPEFGAVGLPLVLSSVPLAFQVKPRSSYRKRADKSIDRAITRYNWNENTKSDNTGLDNSKFSLVDADTELSERFLSSALGAEVQYQDFTFSQNNKPLSLYEVNILTRSMKAGRFKLFIANRQLTRSQSKIKTRKQNALNITLGLAGVGYGVAAIGIPIHSSYGTVLDLTFISGGAALTYGGIVSLKQVSSQDRFKQSADKSFRKVADKLNEAIKAANQ